MAGVDPLNQFPNSLMAQAVKNGQSRMRSTDAASAEVGEAHNVSIATAGLLSAVAAIPALATYAAITAVGGPLYYTLDGSTPSATNYAGVVAAGATVPFYGRAALSAMKVVGTQASVLYMR